MGISFFNRFPQNYSLVVDSDPILYPLSEIISHSSRQSLEVYSRLSIGEAQEIYNQVILLVTVRGFNL